MKKDDARIIYQLWQHEGVETLAKMMQADLLTASGKTNSYDPVKQATLLARAQGEIEMLTKYLNFGVKAKAALK